MRMYTTLGNGKTTKVLYTPSYGEARTITTCPHEAAAAIAFGLERAARTLLSALYPVAVAMDGRPVQARRRLLSTFDSVCAQTDEAAGGAGVTALERAPRQDDPDCWAAAEWVVAQLASATAGCSEAVRKAVRKELESYLQGLDGVLVAALIVGPGYRPGCLRLVFPILLESFSVADVAVDYVSDDHAVYPLGGQVGYLADNFEWVDRFYDQDTLFIERFEEQSVESLDHEAGEGHVPEIYLRMSHLRSWIADARPELLEKFDEQLLAANVW